jgi:hypothetical protein
MAFTVTSAAVFSQNLPADTSINSAAIEVDTLDKLAADTSFDYDLLMKDLDAFLDSILMPHSYFMGNLSVGKGFFNFENKSTLYLQTAKKLTYSPSFGYYDKSGFGFTATGNLVNDNVKMNFYQFSVSPSYDYLENKNLATGVSFTKYVTKNSLPFYTSPLQNELYAYFTWRKWWLRPSVQMSYGWGSRSDYMEREELINSLRLRPRGYTFVNTKESIKDFSLTGSLRHDFYWLDVFAYNDHIRFTPQAVITLGTQKFGFNQSSTTYAQVIRSGANVLYNSENIYLDDKVKFQPLSWSFYLKGEYSFGKFFIQPQMIFDYYYPAATDNFSTLFTVNMGFIF